MFNSHGNIHGPNVLFMVYKVVYSDVDNLGGGYTLATCVAWNVNKLLLILFVLTCKWEGVLPYIGYTTELRIYL